MSEKNRDLTLLEASSIVAGLGLGGGVMGVPYLASMNGLAQVLSLMAVAYGASVLLHLMVAEMVVRDGEDLQLVEIFGKYLFRGKAGVLFTWSFFGLVAVSFYGLLAAYITGCGEILTELTGLNLILSELVTYAVAAGVVFFGLKAVGFIEKYAMIGIFLLVLALCVASLGGTLNAIPSIKGGVKEGLALFGMVMFSFSCFFSVPQAVAGLKHDRRLIPGAVILGISINFALVLVVTLAAIYVSKEVTKIAIIGWGEALGEWASVTGSIFVSLAMLTTFWAVSYALAVIAKERLGWGDRRSWLAATLPSLIVAMIGLTDFLGYLRLVGGAMAIMVALLVVPVLRKTRRLNPDNLDYDMGFFGQTPFQALVILAYVLMAIGSVVTIE